MAAYAAVISLKHTIDGLVNSSHISPVCSTREILEFAYKQTTSLQQVLERLNSSSKRSSKRLDGLDGQIRDCAHRFEDALEFYELNSQEEKFGDGEVRQEITSFVKTVKKMERDYIEELSSTVTEDADDDNDGAVVSSNIDFGVEMVGYFEEFGNNLPGRLRPDDLYFFSFFGVDGSCRSLVAKTIFEDVGRGTDKKFECCAWVTVGAKQELKDVLIRILAQLDSSLAEWEHELLILKEDEIVCNYMYNILEHQRYMIVLDDVRDVQVLDYLRRALPDQCNGSVVILTTSFPEVAQLADRLISFEVTSHQFFEECLLCCLRSLNSSHEPFSLELDEAGKKIAENCRGLYVSAAKTVLFLYKTKKTVEQWTKLAEDKQNPVFMVQDEIAEVSKIKTEIQSGNWDIDDDRRERVIRLISQYVEFSDYVERMKMELHPVRFFSKTQTICLLGMAGIGKSAFARKIFQDKAIFPRFDHHVWITLGPRYQTEEILIDILAQIYPEIDKLHMKEDGELVGNLCVQLSRKRCLIVLDDLWSQEPLHHLKRLFPHIRGTTLVTTRLAKVAKLEEDDMCFEMRLLDEEESWYLFCQKVFDGGECPPELEKAGRKIAEKCDGLPLLILTVADQLLKVGDMSEEYWEKVASGKEKSVFKKSHDQISKALLPSYQRLPQHLKPCFLYLGVFREKYEISTSMLTNLWTAEGFLEQNPPQMVEDFVVECLSELVEESLVMVQLMAFSGSKFKTCRLHSVFWNLANGQAAKSKFFHAMNNYEDCSEEKMKSQRRLCIRNGILLGFKDVQDSMACITSAHSLLCVNPLQQYPVPIDFDMRLLRVMNAITIRLYEFPVEVVRLLHLTYLGLTCNGKLPTSISNLLKLQCLIVKRYMNIKSSKDRSALPVEVWDMKELKHLQVMGGCLPNPKSGDGLLKLSALLDVSAQTCREEVFKLIPNVKRLGIRIELMPDDEGNSFHCLNHISHLHVLESLKCVVTNPYIRSEVGPPRAPPMSMFPSGLRQLSLSGLGYPWEYMSIIVKLENLEVLKLKHYAFQGPVWEMDFDTRFNKLKFLLVQDTNLVQWKVDTAISSKLEHLCIKHCYKLLELPTLLPMGGCKSLSIVDCSPATVGWADEVGRAVKACKVKFHLSYIPGANQEGFKSG